MKTRSLVLTSATLLLLMLSLQSPALGQIRDAHLQQTCIRDGLRIPPENRPPSWISTIEYNRENDEVLIADPKSSELLTYHGMTGAMHRVELPSDVRPASITRIQGGFVLNYRDDAYIMTSAKAPSHLAFTGRISLRRTKDGDATGLGSLYTNWTTWGSKFFGFGSVTRSPGDPSRPEADPARGYQLGFVMGSISASTRQFLDIELLKATEQNDLYLLGLPYFTANDEGFFFVDFTDKETGVTIKRVVSDRAGTAALEPIAAVLPEDLREIPQLKGADEGPNRARDRFRAMERANMIAGLFGQGKQLYVLVRRYAPAGTEWSLLQIDPQRPDFSELKLPTRTNHLSAVPGPSAWYFFERGDVRTWGDQDIRSVIRIPARWISAGKKSRLWAERPMNVRCEARIPLPVVAGTVKLQ